MVREKMIAVKATPEELARYHELARQNGLTLSGLVRSILTKMANKQQSTTESEVTERC